MLYTAPTPQTLPATAEYPSTATQGEHPDMRTAPTPIGSIWQAWASIVRRPSEKVIAACSEAGSTRWVWISLSAVALISIVQAIITNAIFMIANVRLPISNVSGMVTGESVYGFKELLLGAVETPIASIGRLTFIALALAVFLPPSFGNYGLRFLHALKPLALAFAVVQAFVLLFAVCSAALTPLFNAAILAVAHAGSTITQEQGVSTPAGQTALNVIQQNLPQILAWGALEGIAAIGLLVYTLIVLLRAGRVALSLSRWAVFGIALLGLTAWSLVSAAVYGIVAVAIAH